MHAISTEIHDIGKSHWYNDTLSMPMILGNLSPSEVAYVMLVLEQTQKIFLKTMFVDSMESNTTQVIHCEADTVWLHNIHGGLFICLYAAASGCGQ